MGGRHRNKRRDLLEPGAIRESPGLEDQPADKPAHRVGDQMDFLGTVVMHRVKFTRERLGGGLEILPPVIGKGIDALLVAILCEPQLGKLRQERAVDIEARDLLDDAAVTNAVAEEFVDTAVAELSLEGFSAARASLRPLKSSAPVMPGTNVTPAEIELS